MSYYNPDHLRLIKQGVRSWNKWREEYPDIRPDLRLAQLDQISLFKADLRTADLRATQLYAATMNSCDLRDAILRMANLRRADLRNADLRGAMFAETVLCDANLQGANLEGAYMYTTQLGGANLSGASLRGAKVHGTYFGDTILADVDFSDVKGLDECRHRSSSILDNRTFVRSDSLPEQFLRGCGLSDWEIEMANLFKAGVTLKQVQDISRRIFDLRGDPKLQFHTCFISYSNKDRDFVDCLYSALQDRGVRCWIDDIDSKPGEPIIAALNSAIQSQDKIVLCCSRDSLTSLWVEKEIEMALAKEKRDSQIIIIPLVLDNYFQHGWQGQNVNNLRGRIVADFHNWQNRGVFESQLERVINALRR